MPDPTKAGQQTIIEYLLYTSTNKPTSNSLGISETGNDWDTGWNER